MKVIKAMKVRKKKGKWSKLHREYVLLIVHFHPSARNGFLPFSRLFGRALNNSLKILNTEL